MDIKILLESILFLPFIASSLILILGKYFKRKICEIFSVITGLLTFSLTTYLVTFQKSIKHYIVIREFSNFFFQLPFANLEFFIDWLTLVMLFIVSLIGLIIIIYSIGYMHESKDYVRYYALILLFIFGMIGLVISGNFFLLYMFWEIVGFCSFSLIGFWYMRPKASRAGIKAFITTRIGDTLMLAGIILLYLNTGTLSLVELSQKITGIPTSSLNIILLLLFAGSVGKSAQFPLHVWLPDAMEGPTTVSALIHAATMVKAGVYLVARLEILLFIYAGLQPSLISMFSNTVLFIGIFTSFLAASIALTQYDVKGVLAYSTISQLGYMFTTLGLVAFITPSLAIDSCVTHLANHAIFKALLFLAAGCVIHSIEPILGLEVSRDIRYMGGLAKKMPSVTISFLFGALALAGFPPFNGFWSKDLIMENIIKTFEKVPILSIIFILTSLLSVIYILRVTYIIFFSKPEKSFKIKNPPKVMTLPLIFLSLLTIISPFIFQTLFNEITFIEIPSYYSLTVSTSILCIALLIVYLLYVKRPWQNIFSNRFLSSLWNILFNAFFIDYFYEHYALPALKWSFTQVAYSLDLLINRLIENISTLGFWLSKTLRKTHSGRIFTYISMYILGLLILLISSVIWRWIP